MTAGAGWIALAIVVFASWKPLRVLTGAYLFGGVTVLQLNLQAAGLAIPVEYLSMSPYLITIACTGRHVRTPKGSRFTCRACLSGARFSCLELRPINQTSNLGRIHMKRRTLLAAATAALALTGAAFADGHAKTKVGFVYVGPVGDGGWTYEHEQGRLAVEAEFGDKVETIFQESVPEGADAERVITQMALSGANLIFTTSFGYMDPTNAVAAKFPDVKFEHATGYKRETPNVSTYSARFYEGRAIQGHIAGKMTKTNKIGYIASFPIPEVIRGINSAYIHAKKANPDVEFSIIWAYHMVRPGERGGRRHRSDRARCRRDPATHRLHCASGGGSEGGQCDHLRSGVRYGGICTDATCFLDHRQLGPLLHLPRQGGDGWHLGVERHLGWYRAGHGRNR